MTRSRSATSCSPATAADLKSTDGLTVAAEIVAQAKADKVTVFKKRRRHNYRRKKGHRQQHTILKIVAIGDHKQPEKAEGEQRPKTDAAPTAEAPAGKAAEKLRREGEGQVRGSEAGDVDGDSDRESGAEQRGRRPIRRRRAPTLRRRPPRRGEGQADRRNPVDKKCCTC